MKLSSNQLERVAERVFNVLNASSYIQIDTASDDRAEERVRDAIYNSLEDDSRAEDRLAREAERLVDQQREISSVSSRPREELVQEVKDRLARSKRISLDDGPERADLIAEKMFRTLWKVDALEFFADDAKVQNCLARAIYRFRVEDDRIVDAISRLVARKITDEPFSPKWCQVYDRYFAEARTRLAQKGAEAPISMAPISQVGEV